MIGRLVHTTDFKRLLATSPKSRSAHFALHHVSAGPSLPKWRQAKGSAQELSTEPLKSCEVAVDKIDDKLWWASVVPKRHAKRSVTRNALKRQMRLALARHEKTLPGGSWLIRLKAPFLRDSFPSASSNALCNAASAELDAMLNHVRKRGLALSQDTQQGRHV
jgi:ribonuclease P protein component